MALAAHVLTDLLYVSVGPYIIERLILQRYCSYSPDHEVNFPVRTCQDFRLQPKYYRRRSYHSN
jgi:hypothetical protein